MGQQPNSYPTREMETIATGWHQQEAMEQCSSSHTAWPFQFSLLNITVVHIQAYSQLWCTLQKACTSRFFGLFHFCLHPNRTGQMFCYVKTLGPRSESTTKHAVGAGENGYCVFWSECMSLGYVQFQKCVLCCRRRKKKIKQGTCVTQITQQAVQSSEIILHCIPTTFQGHDVICGFLSGF